MFLIILCYRSSFTVIFGLIGTVINRYYYKRTGTDQIPFKGTFQYIYSYVSVCISILNSHFYFLFMLYFIFFMFQGYITKIFCCCGRNLEEPEDTNEKTPLLHPKNIVKPTVEDETLHKSEKRRKNSDDDQQQRRKNSKDDDSNERNNENKYGSLLSERISPTYDKKHRKKKQKSTKSSTSSSDSGQENESWLYQDREKLVKAEHSLLEKLPKEEVIKIKQNANIYEQVITPIESIFEKIGKKFDSSNKKIKEENIESVRNVTSLEPQDVQSSIQSNVTKSSYSSDSASYKNDKIINVSETVAEDDEDESVEVIEEIIYVDEGEDEEEIIEEITETTTVEELPDQFDGSDFEKSQSLTDSGARERPTKVTVRTSIRKISSSSSPGEVKTFEETVINDNSTKNAKKGFGIQLGIGKSGVNMSVGEKKLGIGRSGMKFGKRKEQEDEHEPEAMTIKLNKSGFKLHRNKNKSSVSTEGGEVSELDKQNVLSSEKNKKSKSKSTFKLFKRSTSQPSVADDSIIENQPSPSESVERKVSSSSANLFTFGKSRSRSTENIKRTL